MTWRWPWRGVSSQAWARNEALRAASAPAPPPPEPAARAPLKISAALLDAAQQRSKNATAATPWTLPEPPPGTLPADAPSMAQDADIGSMFQWAGNYYGAMAGFSTGLRFPGYPYLAELTQRGEYRRVSELIAREMTRKWMELTASGDGDKTETLAKIDAEFKRLNVRDAFRRFAEHDGFFGKGQIYLDTGATGDPEELKLPLVVSPAKIAIGSLKRLVVVEPLWTYPAQYNSSNPLAADYYKPQALYVMGKQVHISRWLIGIGREVPDILKPSYLFGGLSLSQIGQPYIERWLQVADSVARLVQRFSTMVLLTNLGSELSAEPGKGIVDRLTLFNLLAANDGTFALDKDTEDFKNVAVPLGTLDHLQAQSQEHQAALYGIPLIVFFGITPSGLNATSDGEMEAWEATVLALQEHLYGANLDRLLQIVQLSLFGTIDPAIGYKWLPLGKMDALELANIRKIDADTAAVEITAGVLFPEEERKRLATTDDSLYPGLDLTELPELPDPNAEEGGDAGEGEDPFASDAGWNESDHPRGQPENAGEFGSGGGSSGGGAKAKAKAKAAAPRLSSTEKSYVSSYTGDDFLETNKKLRSGKDGGESVKHIDAAVSKSTLPAGTKLYRGMSKDVARSLFKDGQVSKGDVISDKAFLSTGASKDFVSTAYGLGGVVFEISTAEGQHGLDVSSLTRNAQEKEFLLPRNTRLRVESIRPGKNLADPVVIKMTTLGDDPTNPKEAA